MKKIALLSLALVSSFFSASSAFADLSSQRHGCKAAHLQWIKTNDVSSRGVCSHGGVVVYEGCDVNGNGYLDRDGREIYAENHYCNAAPPTSSSPGRVASSDSQGCEEVRIGGRSVCY